MFAANTVLLGTDDIERPAVCCWADQPMRSKSGRGFGSLGRAGAARRPGCCRAGFFGVRAVGGPSAALRSVQPGFFPTAFIRAWWQTGGAAHGHGLGVPTAMRARSRAVVGGADCQAAAAAPCWSWDRGDGGVPGSGLDDDGVLANLLFRHCDAAVLVVFPGVSPALVAPLRRLAGQLGRVAEIAAVLYTDADSYEQLPRRRGRFMVAGRSAGRCRLAALR